MRWAAKRLNDMQLETGGHIYRRNCVWEKLQKPAKLTAAVMQIWAGLATVIVEPTPSNTIATSIQPV